MKTYNHEADVMREIALLEERLAHSNLPQEELKRRKVQLHSDDYPPFNFKNRGK